MNGSLADSNEDPFSADTGERLESVANFNMGYHVDAAKAELSTAEATATMPEINTAQTQAMPMYKHCPANARSQLVVAGAGGSKQKKKASKKQKAKPKQKAKQSKTAKKSPKNKKKPGPKKASNKKKPKKGAAKSRKSQKSAKAGKKK